MNLLALALASPPANPYRLVLFPDGFAQVTDADGIPLVVQTDAGIGPVYREKVAGLPAVTDPAVLCEIAEPIVADIEAIRGAAGLTFAGGKMSGTPKASLMALEAGIRMIHNPGGGRMFNGTHRESLLNTSARGIGRRACDAALAVYNLADSAGNVYASPKGGATTSGATSGGSAENSG